MSSEKPPSSPTRLRPFYKRTTDLGHKSADEQGFSLVPHSSCYRFYALCYKVLQYRSNFHVCRPSLDTCKVQGSIPGSTGSMRNKTRGIIIHTADIHSHQRHRIPTTSATQGTIYLSCSCRQQGIVGTVVGGLKKPQNSYGDNGLARLLPSPRDRG